MCVPELGRIYMAKEVTSVDSKYIVWCEVRYPTMNEWWKNRKREGRLVKLAAASVYRNHSTMPSILPPQKKVKKHATKKKGKTKHIHLVWKEVPGYDKVVVQDIQQP